MATADHRRPILGLSALIIAVMMALLLALPATAQALPRQAEYPTLTPLIGADRYETAAMVAAAAYPIGADGVVVASGANFPDALSASTLAGVKDYPIILTEPGRLTEASANAIAALKGHRAVFEIIVVGGESAVSEDAASALAGYGSVNRFYGEDRYKTNLAVYQALAGTGMDASVAILATGANFPDALSISPLAAAKKMPIVLCDGKALASEQSAQLAGASQVIIVGGSGAVSVEIADQLANQGKVVERWEGDDRYKTSLTIARQLIALYGFSLDGFVYTTGTKFPDALASGPYAALRATPVLLLDAGSSQDTLEWLRSNKLAAESYAQAGGYAAGNNTPDTLRAALKATWVPGEGNVWVVDVPAHTVVQTSPDWNEELTASQYMGQAGPDGGTSVVHDGVALTEVTGWFYEWTMTQAAWDETVEHEAWDEEVWHRGSTCNYCMWKTIETYLAANPGYVDPYTGLDHPGMESAQGWLQSSGEIDFSECELTYLIERDGSWSAHLNLEDQNPDFNTVEGAGGFSTFSFFDGFDHHEATIETIRHPETGYWIRYGKLTSTVNVPEQGHWEHYEDGYWA
jgi:putative cell wall-binding protein